MKEGRETERGGKGERQTEREENRLWKMNTNLEGSGHFITTHGHKASPNSYRRPGLSVHLLLLAT